MSSPKKLQVSGLWCASCASALEKRLSEHPEVNRVKVQFVTNTLELETQSGQEIDFHQLNDWIQDLGYRVSPLWDGESAGDKISEQSLWNQISPLIYLGITSFFSMWSLFFSIAYYLEKVHIWATLSGVAASVGSVIGLVPFTRMAWSHMKLKGVTIDLLIVVSTSLLLFLSWWSWAYDQRWMFFESTIMALALVLGASVTTAGWGMDVARLRCFGTVVATIPVARGFVVSGGLSLFSFVCTTGVSVGLD
jgi:cation transport ATPase